MDSQTQSVTLMKLFGTKLFRTKILSKGIVNAGRNTKLLVNYLECNKLQIIGHEGHQCNFNGYVEDYADPIIHPTDKKVIHMTILNQAFRKEDERFPRAFTTKCATEGVAKRFLSLLMLGVAAARDLKLKRSSERRAAKLTIYDLTTDGSSSESDENDSDEGENEDKEGKEEKADELEEESDEESEELLQATQDWPVQPLRPSKWYPEKRMREEKENKGGNVNEDEDDNPPSKKKRVVY